MNYSIYMESTPNPEVMKFVSNKLLFDNYIEFLNVNAAKNYPLIESLFSFPFVQSVFGSTNFISVTKTKNTEWQNIAGTLRTFIIDQLNEHGFKKECSNNKKDINVKIQSKQHSIEEDIKSILQEYIIPAVESDGGYISLKSFKNGVVTLILQGACSGCPSSSITLKNGIETLLKQKLGSQIKEVIASNEE